MVFYTIIAPYSVGFSCILDEVKKCTDFYLFGGGGGGGGAAPEYRILGSEENTWYSPYSSPYSVVFWRCTKYAEYGQEYGALFWWTEYHVFYRYSMHFNLVDRIPYFVKTTEYGQNTDRIHVITKVLF